MNVSVQKAALGRCIMFAQIAADGTARNFTYQQDQALAVTVTATSGNVSFQIRVGAKTPANQAAWDIGGLTGEYTNISVPYTTDANTTAGLIVTALDAAFPDLLVSNIGGGVLTIYTNSNFGWEIQTKFQRGCTIQQFYESFDLETYEGEAMLIGTVTGGDIRYSEDPVTSVSPTTTNGMEVVDGNSFDIVGRLNILNAKYIEVSGTAIIDYQIYI